MITLRVFDAETEREADATSVPISVAVMQQLLQSTRSDVLAAFVTLVCDAVNTQGLLHRRWQSVHGETLILVEDVHGVPTGMRLTSLAEQLLHPKPAIKISSSGTITVQVPGLSKRQRLVGESINGVENNSHPSEAPLRCGDGEWKRRKLAIGRAPHPLPNTESPPQPLEDQEATQSEDTEGDATDVEHRGREKRNWARTEVRGHKPQLQRKRRENHKRRQQTTGADAAVACVPANRCVYGGPAAQGARGGLGALGGPVTAAEAGAAGGGVESLLQHQLGQLQQPPPRAGHPGAGGGNTSTRASGLPERGSGAEPETPQTGASINTQSMEYLVKVLAASQHLDAAERRKFLFMLKGCDTGGGGCARVPPQTPSLATTYQNLHDQPLPSTAAAGAATKHSPQPASHTDASDGSPMHTSSHLDPVNPHTGGDAPGGAACAAARAETAPGNPKSTPDSQVTNPPPGATTPPVTDPPTPVAAGSASPANPVQDAPTRAPGKQHSRSPAQPAPPAPSQSADNPAAPSTAPSLLLAHGSYAAAAPVFVEDVAPKEAAHTCTAYLLARLPRIRGRAAISAFKELQSAMEDFAESWRGNSQLRQLKPDVDHPSNTSNIIITPPHRRFIKNCVLSPHICGSLSDEAVRTLEMLDEAGRKVQISAISYLLLHCPPNTPESFSFAAVTDSALTYVSQRQEKDNHVLRLCNSSILKGQQLTTAMRLGMDLFDAPVQQSRSPDLEGKLPQDLALEGKAQNIWDWLCLPDPVGVKATLQAGDLTEKRALQEAVSSAARARRATGPPTRPPLQSLNSVSKSDASAPAAS